MIQDIAPHVYHNEYKPVPPTADSFILSFEDKKILFHQAGPETEISFLSFRELEGKLPSLYENYIYLFSIDDDHFYLIPNLDISLADNYELHSIRELRTATPRHLAFAGITGHQIFQWYQSRRFCGCCGTPMKHDTKERMMLCPSCGRQNIRF